MFDIFMDEKVITALMLSFLCISIFLRVFLGLLYRNLIRQADNMASTGNKMLKQCKLKFANCYQLSNGVANIPVFVDKFMNRLSFAHMSFGLMYHLSGQSILLSVVFAGVGACRCIMRGKTIGAILPFYIVSFLGLYLYFSVSSIVDIKGKRRALKINLVDYLENHLAPRIDVTRQDIEMLYGEEVFDNAFKKTGKDSADKAARGAKGTKAAKKEGTAPGGKRIVEVMPINGRLTPDEKRDLMAVAERFSDNREDKENERQVPAGDDNLETSYGGEELETLLREFLAL